ncbi:MAG: DUF3391 domain-containing protein [gamma proteobacterium symbiont of Taylorina sp.]|nr:DUF3391 domain-containing protein [gamma proteobacterium symbiont of Taylorina sp.]
MATKKISIDDLKKGMFIHEIDISWIKSPFLRHRRKINTQNDILLLKKAGVKELVIDLSRSDIIQQKPVKKEAAVTAKQESGQEKQTVQDSAIELSATTPDQSNIKKKIKLKDELKVAKVLQGKISKLVNQLGASIQKGIPPSVKQITPILNETRESLQRNDQALLTMLHLYRQDIKLSDHGFGVFAVVLPLAMRMNCSEEEINELGLAALLHDTGWSRLPMHLLGKTTRYTPSELKLIRQHPAIVESVLNKSQEFSDHVKKLVKQHHELIDGSGYPDKLKKNSIYKLVEIFQVADFYDEHIHGLTDKPGMLPVNALKLLYQAAKKNRYNEFVVSELIHVMGIYPVTSAVQLNTGEKAIVEEIDKDNPLLPRLKIIYEADGQVCASDKFLNMAEQDSNNIRSITNVIEPLDEKEDPLGLLQVVNV